MSAPPSGNHSPPSTSACPGCGAVLVTLPGPPVDVRHPGASPSCAALFEETLRGAREDRAGDARTAALVELADAAYAAQHALDPAALTTALVRLRAHARDDVDPTQTARAVERAADAPWLGAPRPGSWTSTPSDIAADLDVVDLSALVQAWADAVWSDWSDAHDQLDSLVAGTGTRA